MLILNIYGACAFNYLNALEHLIMKGKQYAWV